ncbi:type II toxin-antitoxin system VapC family toxin [Roseofilum casamattae]|uniref:Type II toxin-antitoxin system VapC family toxin n=1 Tax=Roseofilum casamattae BLCC-M143 TaxID=3022442 RepID=A0ABT7C126_9CYAN|nr:type II toxin-antitoxin system VapC family toxin [Roseofilum casamattae]MDJ1185159.1 type II toxin-antitoxin system VapC family toxin [Roseofilum casamattae BLCC-M143]
MYVLDTDILIDVLRGHQHAIQWFSNLTEIPSIPGFVVMELIQNSQNKQQVNQTFKLIAPLSIIWLSEADCTRALSDFSQYHLSHGLGLLDALIAHCALGKQATLCTFNVKHYRVIPNLKIAQPYTR